MNWENLLAIALIPIIAPLITRWIEKDKEREEREIDEWEREQAAKKAAKARKALPAPPVLLLDRDRDGTSGDAAGPSDPR